MKDFRFPNGDKILLILLVLLLFAYYGNLLPARIEGFILAAASIVGAIPVAWSALRSLREKKVSVDLLASIALVASFLTGEWASAAFINLMLTSARIFGEYTDGKARSAIRSLLKLRPESIKVRRGGKIFTIPLGEVKVGDLVVVESGDRIPVDGSIFEGEASVDQSSLTGESVPVGKAKGDKVFSSTLAVSGSLLVTAEKVGKDTTLEKIIALVESSGSEKASIRTTVDKFAKWYIIATLAGSFVIYFAFGDMNLLLSLLLVACADDIAVAIPMAFLAAVGYAARRGVIVKGGGYLEALTKIKVFMMDKTGTITRGRMKVADVSVYNGFSEEELLRFAGTAEFFSAHPVAKAIVGYVGERGVTFQKPRNFKESPGRGILVSSGKRTIAAGKAKFLEDSGIKLTKEDKRNITRLEDSGYSVTLVGFNGKLAGFLSCADEVRPHIKDVIRRMKELGAEKVVMLTGDNEKVAARIALEAGITDFHANLMPKDKIDYIKKYLRPGVGVAMVGDGVNDAASLALADVGIAMGAIGSDAAIEAADIALMHDDLKEIPETMELGLYTRKIARQDFLIWGIVNVAGLVLVFAGVLGPNGSAAYNFVTDFLPLLNSLRLFNLHLKLNA